MRPSTHTIEIMNHHNRIITAAAFTLFVFAFTGWLYVAEIAVLHMSMLSLPISNMLPLRKDTFGAICFAVALVSLFVYMLTRDENTK